ncbi:MAG: LysM peptidoglycan-binding domain-containing protein [Formivibrio sp.]|nr:LysM peptidoglycan-binding domain-containing protein [Formivibrio sp.]
MTYRLLAGLLAATFCANTFAADILAEANVSQFDYQLHAPAQHSATVDLTAEQMALISNTLFPAPAVKQEQQVPASQSLMNDVANAPVYTDLWSRIRAGFQMPEMDTPLTHKWEQYYASRPEYLNRIIERGGRYLYHVTEEVEKRGLPMELALLPMIESAYNPKAESPARAAGMWQFIPATGKRYGLERTWWYDGRRDVVAATQAALDYLTEIHGMFNDWQLALASYNWGENAVARAIAKNQAAGHPTDFADLKMPDETANYVPKLMAVRNIIANPEAFGVTLKPISNEPYFVAIDNIHHMDVAVAAQLAETSVDELLRLNPGFIRPVIAQKDERKLVLPADKVEIFQRNLASYDKPLLNWQPYVTHPGEAFTKVAQEFGFSLAELKDVNDIGTRESRARGQTILVPKTEQLDISERQTLVALAANRAAEPVDRGDRDTPHATQISTQYRVSKGDTIFGIAQRFKMDIDQLRTLNHLSGNDIKMGQTLKVASVATPAKPSANKIARDGRRYVAKRGDTVAKVARKFNVASADLAKWNNLDSKRLEPGSKIVIY